MKKLSLNSSVIKNIAYLTMLIDHFFAVVFTEIIRRHSMEGYETDLLIQIRSAGRAIGRASFILFAFLAVESFIHTRSRRNYLLRLGVFAFVSEIPFDLAFSGQIINYKSQNIFFTLFFGVLVLVVWEWAAKSLNMLNQPRVQRDIGWWVCIGVFRVVQFGSVMLGCAAAYFLRTDYKYMGVLLMVTLYLMRGRVFILRMLTAGCVMFLGMWSINYLRYVDSYSSSYIFRFSMRELYGLFAFVPIALYDGTKGRQLPKAVCYGFYPLHLLLLHGIARII